jgi:hypothetical protein
VIFGEIPRTNLLIEIKKALRTVQHSKTDVVPSPRQLIPQPRQPPLRATTAHSSDNQDNSHRATYATGAFDEGADQNLDPIFSKSSLSPPFHPTLDRPGGEIFTARWDFTECGLPQVPLSRGLDSSSMPSTPIQKTKTPAARTF